MRTVRVRFYPNLMRSQLAHPGLAVGSDPARDGRPVIEITGVPDDVTDASVIERWDRTADCTWLGRGPGNGRHSFQFDELGVGRIIHE
jgi:hypothetical protein